MIENRLYSEIFTDFNNQCHTDLERRSFLLNIREPNFLDFLRCCFDPNIVFDVDLPESYRPAIEPAGLNWTTLTKEMHKMYRFVKNHPTKPPELTKKKQTALLLGLLESLHKDEARLLVQMINKDLKVDNLTKELVLTAYPNLF